METEREILHIVYKESDFADIDPKALEILLHFVSMDPRKLARTLRQTIIHSLTLEPNQDVIDNRSREDIAGINYLSDCLDDLK